MASPITFVFFADEDTVETYEDNYANLRRHWPKIRDRKMLLVCNARQETDPDYWREKFFFLDELPKLAMWDWSSTCKQEPTISEKLSLSTMSVCGFACPTPYYCAIHPKLQTVRAVDFPPEHAIDPNDPPMFICNRTDVGIGDADFQRLEEWSEDTVGFNEHPAVDQSLVKAWDLSIVFARFARILSIVTKNKPPIGRTDLFMYYAAVRRGERIVRLDSADLGIVE